MCAPKNSVKICVAKLIDLQEEINEPTVIAGDFRTFISVTDRSSRENISKDIVYLNSTTNQLDFVDVCKIIQKQQNTHSSQADMEHSPRHSHSEP